MADNKQAATLIERIWTSTVARENERGVFRLAIHAGPTCGKTHLVNELRRLGVPVIDTDEVIEQDITWEKWRSDEGRERDYILRAALATKPPAVLISNIWALALPWDSFESYPPKAGGHWLLSVWRPDPGLAVKLAEERGEEQAGIERLKEKWPKWTEGWVSNPPPCLLRATLTGRTFLTDAIASFGEDAIRNAVPYSRVWVK